MSNEANVVSVDYPDVMEENFDKYSKSVILGRALPLLEDGLKPVTRRILYSMNTAISDTNKFKKATFYTGYVTSRYHPHGNLSLYETMVLMSQSFFKPLPCIEAQGNNGSIKDSKSYSAERYLEMRISKFAKEVFFNDFNEDIVHMVQTFDPEIYEPTTLTPSIPTIFLVGNSGIAVGYSVDIPTHNLVEVCDATIAKLKNPELKTKDLMKFIMGPDYASGGMIINHADLPTIYENGNGTIKVQAQIRHTKHLNKDVIEVYGIPATTTLGNIITEISEKVKPDSDKKPGPLADYVHDVLELSDVGKIKLIVVPKKDVPLSVLENLLYTHTSLRTVQNYYTNIIVNNKFVANMPLDVILEEWIKARLQTIRKVFAFKIAKKRERIFIVNALIKCHKHLNVIIELLKKSKDKKDAKDSLILKYGFADKEAEYIVEQKLYKISSLEIDNLYKEKDSLELEINNLIKNIESEKSIKDYAIKDIEAVKKKFGKERKTQYCNISSKIEVKDLIEEKDFIISITNDGYVYSTDLENVKVTKKGTKGFTIPDIKKDKIVEKTFTLNNHKKLMCFTEFGRLFILDAYQLNVNNVHISNLIENLNGEKLVDFVDVDENEEGFLIIMTQSSIVKKTKISEYFNARRTGLLAFKNDDKSEKIVSVGTANSDDSIVVIGTSRGYTSKFRLENISETNRVTKGRQCIRFKEENEVAVSMDIINSADEENALIFLISKKGIGKLTPVSELLYKKKDKGMSSAHLAINLKPNDVMLKSTLIIDIDSEILLTTEKLKTIKITLDKISILKRQAMGNKIITLNEADSVKSVNLL